MHKKVHRNFFCNWNTGGEHEWFITREMIKPRKGALGSILLTIDSAALKSNGLDLYVLIWKNAGENTKLWNNMCDTIWHIKLKTDRIVYTYAENKGQGEYTTKSYQWLLLERKWDMVFRVGRGILGKGNFIYIVYFYVSWIFTKVIFFLHDKW